MSSVSKIGENTSDVDRKREMRKNGVRMIYLKNLVEIGCFGELSCDFGIY